MSERKTMFVEVEYRDGDMMEKVRSKMLERRTGQLVLNLGQGRISSVVWRERLTQSENGNGHEKNLVDKVAQM